MKNILVAILLISIALPSFANNSPPYEPYEGYPDGVMGIDINSPLKCRVADPDNDTLNVYFYWANGTLIGIAYNVTSNSTATIYPELEEDTYYEWYAVAYDGEFSTKSSIWCFGTTAYIFHLICGYCYYLNGSNLAINVSVSIINNCSQEVVETVTDGDGFFQKNLGSMFGPGWANNTPLKVMACGTDEYEGWTGYTYARIDYFYTWANITLYPSVVYVDDDFNSSTPKWGLDHFNSIQDGIDTCMEGGIVYVYNGTYNESIFINKSINVVGKSKNAVISSSSLNAVKINADNVKIENMSIESSSYAAIYIAANNVSIANCSLNASLCTYGIYINKSSNISILNNDIENFSFGIETKNASVYIENNSIVNCGNGIRILFSDATIKNNDICNAWKGIHILNSSSCKIIHNNISFSYYGTIIENCQNDSILNNTFINCGLVITGNKMEDFLHEIEGNIVNGKELSYHKNENDFSIYNVGEVIIVNCSNISIIANISNATIGMEIAYCYNISIINSSLSRNEYGIWIMETNIVKINESNAYKNEYGFYLLNSSNIIINGCLSFNNYVAGISLLFSSNISIENCDVFSNDDGIDIYRSNGISVINSEIKSNVGGLSFVDSNSSIIHGNFIYNNTHGIILYNSSNNIIYNNYFANEINAWDNSYNTWNISKTYGKNIVGGNYIAGNCWHDYEGHDKDGDAIGDGDLPYNCNGNISHGGDYSPLTTPWDVNDDDKVDILDLIAVASHWLSKRGEANYNAMADVNRDGIINILDLIIIGQHFGSIYS